MARKTPPNQVSVIALYLGVACLFGSTFYLVHFTNRSIPPFTVVAVQLVLGAVFLTLYILPCWIWTRGQYPKLSFSCLTVVQIFFLGTANLTIPLALMRIATRCMSIGMAGILHTSKPFFALFFSFAFLPDSRPLHWLRPVGMCVAFFGAVMMCLHLVDTPDDLDCSETMPSFVCLVLLASALAGLCAVLVERRLSGVDAVSVAWGQSVSGSIVGVMLSLLVDLHAPPAGYANSYQAYIEDILLSPTWMRDLGLVASAVACSCLAWILFFHLLSIQGSTKQLTSVFIEMMVCVGEGIVFMGDWESVTPVQRVVTLAGCVMVTIGTCMCLQQEGHGYAYSHSPYSYLPLPTTDSLSSSHHNSSSNNNHHNNDNLLVDGDDPSDHLLHSSNQQTIAQAQPSLRLRTANIST